MLSTQENDRLPPSPYVSTCTLPFYFFFFVSENIRMALSSSELAARQHLQLLRALKANPLVPPSIDPLQIKSASSSPAVVPVLSLSQKYRVEDEEEEEEEDEEQHSQSSASDVSSVASLKRKRPLGDEEEDEPPPLQKISKASPLEVLPPIEFVQRVQHILGAKDKPLLSTDISLWGDLMELVSLLSQRFLIQPDPLYQALCLFCKAPTFDQLTAQWIALHYATAYVRIENQTGPYSLAATLNLSRLAYLSKKEEEQGEVKASSSGFTTLQSEILRRHQTGYVVSASIDADTDASATWKASLQEKFNAYEASWDKWGNSIGSSLDQSSDASPEHLTLMKVALLKKTLELTSVTVAQRFWLIELAQHFHHFLKWCLYPPGHVCEWKALLAFWAQQKEEMDYIALQLFVRHHFLQPTTQPLSVEWFEEYTRWLHSLTLQLFYAHDFPWLELQASKADRDKLVGKQGVLTRHIEYDLETYYFGQLQQLVMRAHMPGSRQYAYLQSVPDPFERFFYSPYAEAAKDVEPSFCIGDQFPMLLSSFLTSELEQYRSVEAIFRNVRTFLYPFALLKVFDSESHKWMCSSDNKRFTDLYFLSPFAWGTTQHWRLRTRPAEKHLLPTPIFTLLFGTWMVRTYHGGQFQWIVARDVVDALLSVLHAIRLHYGGILRDVVMRGLNMTTLFPTYLSTKPASFQPYTGSDNEAKTLLYERPIQTWKNERYMQAEWLVQQEQDKRMGELRLRALKDQADEYDREEKRQKHLEQMESQVAQWIRPPPLAQVPVVTVTGLEDFNGKDIRQEYQQMQKQQIRRDASRPSTEEDPDLNDLFLAALEKEEARQAWNKSHMASGQVFPEDDEDELPVYDRVMVPQIATTKVVASPVTDAALAEFDSL